MDFYLDGIFCVGVVVVAVSLFAISTPTATIDGDEKNQVNNQQNVSQHQDDAQRRLVRPKEAQHQSAFSSSNTDRYAVVAVIIIPWRRHSGRRGTRFRRHDAWIYYCPIPHSFLKNDNGNWNYKKFKLFRLSAQRLGKKQLFLCNQ